MKQTKNIFNSCNHNIDTLSFRFLIFIPPKRRNKEQGGGIVSKSYFIFDTRKNREHFILLLLFAVIVENQNIIMAPKEGLFWINLFLFLINIILTFRGLLFAEKRISKRARSGVKYTHLTSSFHSYVNLFLLLPLAQSIITQIKKIKGTSPLIFLIFFFWGCRWQPQKKDIPDLSMWAILLLDGKNEFQ